MPPPTLSRGPDEKRRSTLVLAAAGPIRRAVVVGELIPRKVSPPGTSLPGGSWRGGVDWRAIDRRVAEFGIGRTSHRRAREPGSGSSRVTYERGSHGQMYPLPTNQTVSVGRGFPRRARSCFQREALGLGTLVASMESVSSPSRPPPRGYGCLTVHPVFSAFRTTSTSDRLPLPGSGPLGVARGRGGEVAVAGPGLLRPSLISAPPGRVAGDRYTQALGPDRRQVAGRRPDGCFGCPFVDSYIQTRASGRLIPGSPDARSDS